MTFGVEMLLKRLAEFSEIAGQPARYLIAFSGGLDSTVLTHVLASSRESHRVPILAVHIDHGLQAESAAWRDACETFARQLGIDFLARQVAVALDSGLGPEASAREARQGFEPTSFLVGDRSSSRDLRLYRGGASQSTHHLLHRRAAPRGGGGGGG